MKDSRLIRLTNSVISITVQIFQWPLVSCVKALRFFGDKKTSFPHLFKMVLVYSCALCLGYIASQFGWSEETAEPHWWPSFLDDHIIGFSRAFTFIISISSTFAVFIFCRAIMPLLFYTPHAMAMREMGLLEARSQKNGMQAALGKYLKYHDDQKKIKIICISGFNLFGRYDGHSIAPLYAHAKNGNLEVLFPASDQNNPTIKARYETYNEQFKKSQYPDISDLIREIDKNKRIVRENGANGFFEHNELCMWRVVLLSNHCIVQTYFPNHAGCHSDLSPVFVFEDMPECPYSYYDTFLKMFTLLTSTPATD